MHLNGSYNNAKEKEGSTKDQIQGLKDARQKVYH